MQVIFDSPPSEEQLEHAVELAWAEVLPPRVAESDEPDDTKERAEAIADLLQSLYGDDALTMLDQLDDPHQLQESDRLLEAQWSPQAHPRGKDGRFIPKNSPEAVSATKEKVKAALAKPSSKEGAAELLSHLNLLTVAQINQLKQEHGVSASGKNREELVKKIADRLNRGRRAEQEPAEEPAKVISVGDGVTYTGRGASPDESVEFRGYHDSQETGEKMARVIFRPKSGPPFETSVKATEITKKEAGGEQEKPREKETNVPQAAKDEGRKDAGKHGGVSGQGASVAPQADWRAELKGKPRWQAVEILRKQDPGELTLAELENLHTWDHESPEQDKGFQDWRHQQGRIGTRTGEDLKPEYNSYMRQKWEAANDAAFIAGKPVAQKPDWATPADEYLGYKANQSAKDAEHKPLVASAIAAGKPVPAAVLADYPDLATPAGGQTGGEAAGQPAEQPAGKPGKSPESPEVPLHSNRNSDRIGAGNEPAPQGEKKMRDYYSKAVADLKVPGVHITKEHQSQYGGQGGYSVRKNGLFFYYLPAQIVQQLEREGHIDHEGNPTGKPAK